MSAALENGEFHERTQEIQRLVQRIQAWPDENARATGLDLMRSVMDLHSSVLSRVIELAVDAGEPGRDLLLKLCADPLISGMLVLYGLHPLDLTDRLEQAIEKLRPDLQARGGSVELLAISETAVRVRVHASGGCGSSPELVKGLVQQAIYEAAPEVLAVEVEGMAAAAARGFVPLSALQPDQKENSREKPAA